MEKIIDGDIMTWAFDEDLTSNNVREFNIKTMDLLDETEDIEELVLDFSSVKNVDSVGVTFVINLYKAFTKEGKEFRIINSSDDVKHLFKLMKLDEFILLDD